MPDARDVLIEHEELLAQGIIAWQAGPPSTGGVLFEAFAVVELLEDGTVLVKEAQRGQVP